MCPALYMAAVLSSADPVAAPPLVIADTGEPVASTVTDPPLVHASVDPAPGSGSTSSDFFSTPHFALAFDAGAPDGLGASLGFRPWSWIRMTGGVLTNSVSPGIRGGVTLIPFHFGITPTFGVEVGHYFDGDANRTVDFFTQSPGTYRAALAHVGYDFVNGQFGIEMGPPDRWTFSLRGGLSYVHASAALQQDLQQAGVQNPSAGGVLASGAGWLLIPSLKASLTLYLF